MRKIIFILPLLVPSIVNCQFNLGDKLKDKLKDKVNNKLEKKQKDYDESNFNYAILFLDNSSAFESEEKGSAFSSNLLSASKLLSPEDRSLEDGAYLNLKNGEMLMAGNKFSLAEKSFKLAKLMYEEDGQTTTLNYAQTLSDLALLYQSRGRFTIAGEFSEKALKLREGLDNKGMLLVSINNNAVLKKETGLYAGAEADIKKAIELSGTLNDRLASALVHNNLAMTYLDMNNLKAAEEEINKCVADAEVSLKDNSANYIKLLINKANILRFAKKYPEAEELYLKCIDLKERRLGAHPDLAHLKMGLAQLYMEMGKQDRVEDLLQSACDINKRKLGENNPATLAVMQQQANFYRFNNKPEKSLELITAVVNRKKQIYGESHPNYIQALEDMALSQWLNNRISETKNNYKSVIDNTLNYVNTFFSSLSESEKNLYWDKTNKRLQRFFSFAYANYKSDPELVTTLYNTLINTKGFLLNTSSKIRSNIYASSDSVLKKIYTDWLQTKEYLNVAFQLSREEQAAEKINADSLQSRASDLEIELSKRSNLFKESKEDKTLSSGNIQSVLGPAEALIEMVEISEYSNGFTGKENYVALVVKAGSLTLIELGDGAGIEKAVMAFKEKIIHTKPENQGYLSLWKPMEESLAAVRKLYVSLDGAYHKVSIYALKDPAGKYLLEKYEIFLVGNSKDVISMKASEGKVHKPVSAVLFGNPLYGSGGLVQQLEGTEAEVKKIEQILKGLKVKTGAAYGAAATEQKLKEIQSPDILHIATHGYFLADVSNRESPKVLGVELKAAGENPLLRSGLLLANCENVFDENYLPVLRGENGVLTAYEAMSLNLDKTDLVVLSACETGLGSIKQGEGVYGLQRAFLIAGANSIIMSLWSVSDEATMELMSQFYSNYGLTGNKTRAFYEAIKQLKLKYKEPFYWSAFVMLNRQKAQ